MQDERIDRIERTVIRLDQRMDAVLGTLSDMAKGWEILGGQIGDIHDACCGKRPPSELAEALRELAAAVDRQGEQIKTLVTLSAKSTRWPTREEWEIRHTGTPIAKLQPDKD